MEKVKEIVENNEVRRLPKIPKVRIVLFAQLLFFYLYGSVTGNSAYSLSNHLYLLLLGYT